MKFETVRGMRDYAPEKARKWLVLRNACVEVFDRYGFEPLQTPMVEYYDVLAAKGAGGDAIKEEIYYFKDKSGRGLGLRFDLTVPLARFVAKNPQIPKPFKRYTIDRVYRYDRPGEKRYREFMQADADIVGSDSIYADFECIAIAVELMKKLGTDFCIRVNNQKLLREASLSTGVKKNCIRECFRCLDKLDKIGEAGVAKELKQNKIPTEIVSLLNQNNLDEIEKRIKDKSGLNELKELLALVKKEGMDKFVKVDLCLARGLDYYTGNVFEVNIKGVSSSVGGGGRYDNLIGLLGGEKLPAVGISFGIDRLLDILEEKINVKTSTRVFVVAVGKEIQLKALELTQKIRGAGIKAAMDLNARGISKNLEYANKGNIPFVVILGENELKKKEFTLKDMKTGKEKKIKISEVKKLKKLVE